jgi:hypothetical protein
MKPENQPGPWEIPCQLCGKRFYVSKAVAKLDIRRRFRGQHMSVYRCPARRDFWHVGNLPRKVVQGKVDRRVLRVNPVRSTENR